ncbi:glycosyltransferase [Corynebacterium glutamicum]|uniref:glycosyltransferase n=1 Tax=Corynebacterium glutamicum TaxID=1718 RepID=UPI000AAAE04A|nr:glycosyltransferase [Corynebacterium glutamicum]
MKAGFFHDSQITIKDKHYFSKTLTPNVWNRYLEVFESLQVSTRVKSGETDGLQSSETTGIEFAPITNYSNPSSLILHPFKVVSEIRTHIRKIDCAIIRLPSFIGWIACLLAQIHKVPVIIEAVGCPWDAYGNHSKLGKLFAPIARWLNQKCIANAPFVIYVTDDFLQKRYPTRGVSAGISDVNIHSDLRNLKERIHRISTQANAEHKFSNLERPIILGSVGDVGLKYKGYQTSVDAVRLLIDEGINVEYQIVGPGNPAFLQSYIDSVGLSEVVHLVGPIPGNELKPWFQEVDIYLQPSLVEGLPRAVIEAMSFGLPVILSNIGGHPELVNKKFLFDVKDHRQLSKLISSTMTLNQIEISKTNFNTASFYDVDKLTERRTEILNQFLEFSNQLQSRNL